MDTADSSANTHNINRHQFTRESPSLSPQADGQRGQQACRPESTSIAARSHPERQHIQTGRPQQGRGDSSGRRGPLSWTSRAADRRARTDVGSRTWARRHLGMAGKKTLKDRVAGSLHRLAIEFLLELIQRQVHLPGHQLVARPHLLGELPSTPSPGAPARLEEGRASPRPIAAFPLRGVDPAQAGQQAFPVLGRF